VTWTPGGAQTRSKQHQAFGGSPAPATAVWATGVRVHAGCRTYTDWTASLASVGLGYAYPPVEAAVREAIYQGGPALPLPHAIEEEYAEQLCRALGWPEQARFVKSGSEATAAAMMIARRKTGRHKVVSIGYHGWHGCHLPSPELVDIPWGSFAAYDVIDETVAAVIVEPMRNSAPPRKYLDDLLQAAHDYGALFIMDEMVTGFRWAIGGATEYFQLEPPDLACFGKAMANGYPLAALVGKRGIMQHATDVSSTHGGDVVALSAARATLKVYQKRDVIGRMNDLGRELLDAVPDILTGYPVHPVFRVAEGGSWLDSTAAVDYTRRALAAGHLVHPAGINIMLAHTREDVQSLARALRG
jgi:glutamate-1-semialdehyde 2,1-aminomutase